MLSTLLLTTGCGKKEVNETGITKLKECKGAPGYLGRAGFVPGKPFGFSVAERGVTGLSLIQFPAKGVPYKSFRLPGWEAAGHLGAVVTDKEGNSFVIPRPFVNTLKNDPLKQNTIYKVHTRTGEMTPYIQLEPMRAVNPNNPFGLLGLALDCENDLLYASSVAGSDAANEAGSIYVIRLGEKPEVITTLSGVDAMGVGISYFNDEKYLFFGKARSSEVYRIQLTGKGEFVGQPVPVLTLSFLGDRGDDKPRKIRFDARGNMLVAGISFNFNLANSPDKQETIYTFHYQQGKWLLISIQKGIL